jgi:hypothetical protein
MKQMKKNWHFFAMIGMMLLMASCESNSSDEPTADNLLGGEGNILVEATVKNADGASGMSYIEQVSDLSGTLNLAKGVQIGFSGTLSVEGNNIYVFPEFGTSGKQVITKYEHTPKGLKLAGELQIVPNSYPVNLTQVSADKAYVPMYNLGKVMVVNTSTFTKVGEIDLTQYAHKDNSAEPSYGIVRDGLYFLPLDQVGTNWMPYDDHRQVDIAVIDIKTDKLLQVISEKESGLCMPTRPFLKDMIFTDENNDIYVTCIGYFGYSPLDIKNGFVCIPSGKLEFDESKTWDISNTAIEGSTYKSTSIYNSKYIGNGKVAAYVGVQELMSDNPYTARNSMAVIIDLKTKTIKKVEGVPYTDGHSVAIEYHNGEVLFASCGADASGVFAYNPITGVVRHILSTSVNVAFMHFFD